MDRFLIRKEIEKEKKDLNGNLRNLSISLNNQKPNQPICTYPRDNQNRAFVSSWYKMFPWIEYNIQLDRAFCFSCIVHGTKISSQTFVTEGFKLWKNAIQSFQRHENSEMHQFSMTKWLFRENNQTSCASLLISQHEKEIEQNKENLKIIIDAVLYCAKQAISFRGHDETNSSYNKGNFKEIIYLMA